MLPVLYIFFNSKPPLKLSLLILIASTFAASVQPHITSRASVVQFIPCFLGGVFSFNLFSKSIPKKSSWILFPVFLLAVSLLYLGVEFINPNTHHPQWLGWVLCLGTGIALPYFANIPQNGFASLCKIIARYSYGIYLFHIIALWFAFSVCKDFSQFLQWTIFLTICCFFPVLTYHLIEKPLIQMGNQIALKFNN
jgi:peptidoglycan/LPS O-acetylase OafA/YrhL